MHIARIPANVDRSIRPARVLTALGSLAMLVAAVAPGLSAVAVDDGSGAPDGPTAVLPGGETGAAVVLPAGVSQLQWPDEETPMAAFAASAGDALVAVYHWDYGTRRWQRYFAGAPGYSRTLHTLTPGRSYTIVTRAPLEILFPVVVPEPATE